MKLSNILLAISLFASTATQAATDPCTKGTKYDQERNACVSDEIIDPCSKFQTESVPKIYFSNKRKKCEYCPTGRYDFKSQKCAE